MRYWKKISMNGRRNLSLQMYRKKYQKKADQLTIDFAKQHAYDESFDSLVKSTYTKTEAAKKAADGANP